MHDLGAQAERLGVVAFSVDVDDADEGACVELTADDDRRLGVAVINGNQDPGRRRWTLAHELAHFLVGDAYAADHPGGDVERYLNSFVVHLLMPRTGVEKLWRATVDRGARVAALTLSARYRASWSAACSQLRIVGLVDRSTSDRLRREHPTPGDYLALGETWAEELPPPFVPPGYPQCHSDSAFTASAGSPGAVPARPRPNFEPKWPLRGPSGSKFEHETLVDELAAIDMRLPADGKDLFTWAYLEGLLLPLVGHEHDRGVQQLVAGSTNFGSVTT